MLLRRFGAFRLALLVAATALLLPGSVAASVIVAGEVGDVIGTATVIPGSAFTTPSPPTAFGSSPTVTIHGAMDHGLDVDWFAFTLTTGPGYFDVDGADPFFDAFLTLFDAGGAMIAFADDSALDPGSAGPFDSFIGVTSVPVAGTYFLAISDLENIPTELAVPTTSVCGPSGNLRPDGLSDGSAVCSGAPVDPSFINSGFPGATGSYTIHVTALAPEPSSSLLLGFGLVGLAAARRRTRQ